MKELNKRISTGMMVVIYFVWMYVLEYNFGSKIITEISKIGLVINILITIFLEIREYRKNKKLNYKIMIISMIIIGITLRTSYISYTDIDVRQHDVNCPRGHLEYIETIHETGKLPEDNELQFYQQPLHHIIASSWIKLNKGLGFGTTEPEYIKVREGIQNLTAIYSSMIVIVTYYILKELKIKDVYKLLVIMIIAVHPTFIILSGSINNDILMIMFTFFAILYLIKWNKKNNYKNTIILALLTASIALTKISGTIIAIPIMYIFINRAIKDYCHSKDKKQILISYILKFGLFGLISLGFGLLYTIRNMIMFNQGIFYVPIPHYNLYCGDNSLLDRLTIFSKELISTPYGNTHTDSNIPAFIVKCSLFGEYNLNNVLNNHTISILLIIMNCLLILISVISFIINIYKYKRIKKKFKVYLNLFNLMYISQMFMYLYSNISMPFGCTMDFRYIVPTIFTGMMFIITNMMYSKKNENYILKHRVIYILVLIFVILSMIFEVMFMERLKF